MNSFKVPDNIAQDLLLINDFLGPLEKSVEEKADIPPAVEDDDCIDSSGSEGASEDEIEQVLVKEESAETPSLKVPYVVSS